MTTLTPLADLSPVPRVLVDVPVIEFPVGSVTVSLTRTSEGRTFDVRGGQRLPATSPAIVIDPEAGFGVSSAYTVVGYDAAGAIVGSFPLGSTTLLFDGTVIQQPLDPRLSAQVELMGGTGREVSRVAPGSPAYPQGRVVPNLVGLGPRRALQSVPLEIQTQTFDDAVTLDASLGTYDVPQLPVWLVRTPPDHWLPRVLFCHVPDLVRRDTFLITDTEFTHFSASVTEVRPPAAGISASVLRYSDVRVFYSTYSAVKARYATYSDVKRDTSLVGASNA